jgi:hypothetical protein
MSKARSILVGNKPRAKFQQPNHAIGKICGKPQILNIKGLNYLSTGKNVGGDSRCGCRVENKLAVSKNVTL